MKMRASSWGGFLLRMAIATAILVALCWLGMRMMPGQNLRVTLVTLFAFSAACGAFVPKGGLHTPTSQPSNLPTLQPSNPPTLQPSNPLTPQPSNPPTFQPSNPLTSQPSNPGEAEYARARAMPHQEIPDFKVDGLYLDLLGESADKGYALAMAKLGDYAMRREAWVEAYYWMWRAQRSGMANLESELRRIRRCWMTAGCPDEDENVHDLFDEERGSIGRALLGIATNRDAASAMEFLKTNHPELQETL